MKKKVLGGLIVAMTILVGVAFAGEVFYRNTFSNCTVGILSLADFNREWNSPAPLETCGVGGQSPRVVINSSFFGDKFLSVFFPEGTVGPQTGGAEWRTYIGGHEEVMLSYDVRFADGLDFVRGGKLPGLSGGKEIITGGKKADGKNGFSVRLMWRANGRAVLYLYYPDGKGQWGDDFPLTTDGKEVFFKPGQWQKIRIKLVLNQPGSKNGSLSCWIDGQQVANIQGLRFRDIPELKVDYFLFSTFFGGNDVSWAPKKTERIDFDNFELSQ